MKGKSESMAKKIVVDGLERLETEVHNGYLFYPGDKDQLADRCGVPKSTLLCRVNPENQQHKLGLIEWVELMVASRNFEPLRIVEDIVSKYRDDCPEPPEMTMAEAVMNASAENGDVSRVVMDALAKGGISMNDHARIKKEIAEAQEALAKAEQVLNAVFDANLNSNKVHHISR